MAEHLNNRKIEMGVALPVKNQQPAFGAAAKYYALKVECEGGDPEYWLLFTEKELYSLPLRKGSSWSKDLKLGRLFELSLPGKDSSTPSFGQFLCRIKRPVRGTEEYEEVLVWASGKKMNVALERAKRNPEDIPKQSWLQDMMD